MKTGIKLRHAVSCAIFIKPYMSENFPKTSIKIPAIVPGKPIIVPVPKFIFSGRILCDMVIVAVRVMCMANPRRIIPITTNGPRENRVIV